MIAWFLKVYPFLAWAGSLIIFGSCLVAGLAYRGKMGERYSIGSHFVSELGEVGVSRLAWVFNGGLVLGSALLFLMMPGVGISLKNVWGYLGSLVGMVAAVGCLFVGLYPMNNIKPHIRAAMVYFRGGLATIFLFGIAVLVQPAATRLVPLSILIIGGLAFVSYVAFLTLLGRSREQGEKNNALDTSTMKERPRFGWMPFLEWMVVLLTILWFLVVSTAR